MTAFDYIYQNLDPTIAYCDHTGCSLGIFARCNGMIYGKAGLFCQTLLANEEEVTLEPTNKVRALKDLVMTKGRQRE